MSFKRKFSDHHSPDSDEDEPSLGKQVLPVAKLPHNFSGEPTDGMQYLFMVRRDARLLPRVTRSANPYEIQEEVETVAVETTYRSGSHPALPSEAWRETFLRHFRNFRKIPPAGPSRKVVPEKKERDLWWAFLNGRPASEWNPPKQPKKSKQKQRYASGDDRYGGSMRGFEKEHETVLSYDSMEQTYSMSTQEEGWHTTAEGVELASTSAVDFAGSLPTPNGTPAPSEFGEGPSNHDRSEEAVNAATSALIPPEPTPSLMQRIDHRYALHLLMYFTYWINLQLEHPNSQHEISETHARWMFVLLSRVEDYISADEMSLLRNLARACIRWIGESKRLQDVEATTESPAPAPSRMDERSCWMVITAVVGIWGQKDLWMDAEAVLAKLQL
ncbi:uncharacterized protein LAESUDRAFT_710129 [Laetiporus sulphureus 93-53]|uniref:Uncharacterized protein n=1 Tax=Laetiporus sulphureus 93-53 TaxID=1314785 RepID=A0A165IG73_9APHY|nr:uncharacterized protein LAESUDRAFT_710129 [Laetiporus sulphureus 93-53]KZT13029.1 hypothetical protein LAESUDRAFT_710129 [Laetiporus sulphureus 93-53]